MVQSWTPASKLWNCCAMWTRCGLWAQRAEQRWLGGFCCRRPGVQVVEHPLVKTCNSSSLTTPSKAWLLLACAWVRVVPGHRRRSLSDRDSRIWECRPRDSVSCTFCDKPGLLVCGRVVKVASCVESNGSMASPKSNVCLACHLLTQPLTCPINNFLATDVTHAYHSDVDHSVPSHHACLLPESMIGLSTADVAVLASLWLSVKLLPLAPTGLNR